MTLSARTSQTRRRHAFVARLFRGGSSFGPDGTSVAQDTTGVPSVAISLSPGLRLSDANLSFPRQVQGTASSPQTITIADSGNAPLQVSGLSFAGPNAGDYSVASSSCGVVEPSQSCQVTVRFEPQDQGPSHASLVITSNDSNSPATVTLDGEGSAPQQAGSGQPGTAGGRGTQHPSGPQGSQTPTGKQAPAGNVACRHARAAHGLCTLELTLATSAQSGAQTQRVRFVVQRNGRTVGRGTITVRRGKVARVQLHSLPAGRYVWIVSSTRGRILLKRTFTVKR